MQDCFAIDLRASGLPRLQPLPDELLNLECPEILKVSTERQRGWKPGELAADDRMDRRGDAISFASRSFPGTLCSRSEDDGTSHTDTDTLSELTSLSALSDMAHIVPGPKRGSNAPSSRKETDLSRDMAHLFSFKQSHERGDLMSETHDSGKFRVEPRSGRSHRLVGARDGLPSSAGGQPYVDAHVTGQTAAVPDLDELEDNAVPSHVFQDAALRSLMRVKQEERDAWLPNPHFALGTDPLLFAHYSASPLPESTVNDNGAAFDSTGGHSDSGAFSLAAAYHGEVPSMYHSRAPHAGHTECAHERLDHGRSSGSSDWDYALQYTPSVLAAKSGWSGPVERGVLRHSSSSSGNSEPQLPKCLVPLVAAHPTYLSSSLPASRGRHAPTLREPLHWASQTTAATKQAAIARRKPGIEARFACHFCGESFTRAYNLRGHLRAHNGEKPFHCNFPGCNKAFARSHDRRRHQDLHSGACKYRCKLCERPFRRLDALNRHIKQENEQPCSALDGPCYAHSCGHCLNAVGPLESVGDACASPA